MPSFSFPALDAAAASMFQGQQLLTEQQTAQQNLELRKQQVEGARMTNLLNQQAQQDRQALSRFLSQEQQTAEVPARTASDMASLYTKASNFALSRGDFDGAQAMEKLAKGQIEEATKAQALVEKQRADAQDQLSVAAQNVMTNPTPENRKVLVQKAVAAGVNPLEIPMPDDPGFKAFVNQQAMAGMTGAKRLEFTERVREEEARAKALKEERDQRHEEREDARKDRATAREQTTALQREGLELRKMLADSLVKAREAKAASAEAGGAIQHRNTIAAVNYANEAVRGLDLIADMSKGMTGSTFAHLDNPSTILKSLEKTGTNKLTPEMQQIYQTATKGLGLEMAQMATAGSGRGPNKDLIREMSNMVEATPGDKEFEIMFKVANAADFVKARLQAVPKSSDPNIQKIREQAEERLARYPHPSEIIELARKHNVKLGKAQKQVSSMRQTLDAVGKEPAAPPPEIQSILDLYPAQQ